jgi:hypothetical protein
MEIDTVRRIGGGVGGTTSSSLAASVAGESRPDRTRISMRIAEAADLSAWWIDPSNDAKCFIYKLRRVPYEKFFLTLPGESELITLFP